MADLIELTNLKMKLLAQKQLAEDEQMLARTALRSIDKSERIVAATVCVLASRHWENIFTEALNVLQSAVAECDLCDIRNTFLLTEALTMLDPNSHVHDNFLPFAKNVLANGSPPSRINASYYLCTLAQHGERGAQE